MKTKFSKQAEKILQVHESFARDVVKLKGNLQPMLAFSVKGNVIPVINIQDRDVARMAMDMAKSMKADWFVFMNEAYQSEVKLNKNETYEDVLKNIEKDYRHGELEEKFKGGDSAIKDVIIVNVFVRRDDGTYEKLGSSLDKKTLKRVAYGEIGGGYLGGEK